MCKNKLKEFDIGEVAGKDKQTEYNKYTLDCFVDTHADEVLFILYLNLRWVGAPHLIVGMLLLWAMSREKEISNALYLTYGIINIYIYIYI